jgi:hypothetical protein
LRVGKLLLLSLPLLAFVLSFALDPFEPLSILTIFVC